MATRSTISLETTDKNGIKTIKTIYCHWDGYLSHNGVILKECYNTIERVEKLLELGDLSILGQELAIDEYHTFDKPVRGVCVAYGRDRGEENTNYSVCNSYEDMRKEEYNYIFKDNKWFYFCNNKINNIQEVTDKSFD